ncbi:hypothetical protein F4813DRAFT_370201 [Daldinia decipiens]|uniref:uncharacterized protein n=1 Tax=Daldinia decipiens TaxID=326647 RepID=UPI0020C358F3|nr:uncharacterized protein F4813DRAFT_370201 [Daldinia decipiens]KAI1654519.1 hypothetical protein F4813DRAFT_370201 [Daldinia decipiens]
MAPTCNNALVRPYATVDQLRYYNWQPASPNPRSSNDAAAHRAFYSVPPGIYPNNTALLCRHPPRAARASSVQIYQSLGLTQRDADWLLTRAAEPVYTELSELPPAAEHVHDACALCTGDDGLHDATFLCGFHFCLAVGAHTPSDFEVLACLRMGDRSDGGIRCSGDPFRMVSTLTRIKNLLVNSTPDYEHTSRQVMSNRGLFGAVGDDRPAH